MSCEVMRIPQHVHGEDSLSREEPWRGRRLEVSLSLLVPLFLEVFVAGLELLVLWFLEAFMAGLGSIYRCFHFHQRGQ